MHDCFIVEGDELVVEKSRFVSYGAGIPEVQDAEGAVFSVTDEPPFDFAIGVNCRRVFPAPYIAVEGSLSSPRLN